MAQQVGGGATGQRAIGTSVMRATAACRSWVVSGLQLWWGLSSSHTGVSLSCCSLKLIVCYWPAPKFVYSSTISWQLDLLPTLPAGTAQTQRFSTQEGVLDEPSHPLFYSQHQQHVL